MKKRAAAGPPLIVSPAGATTAQLPQPAATPSAPRGSARIVTISPQVFSLDAGPARYRRPAGHRWRAAPAPARPGDSPLAHRCASDSFDRIERSVAPYQLDDFAYKQYLSLSVQAVSPADHHVATGDQNPASNTANIGILMVQQRTFTDAAAHHSKESTAPAPRHSNISSIFIQKYWKELRLASELLKSLSS